VGANSLDDLWREKLLAWKASGISAQAWCHQQQIDYSVFGFWYRRLFPQEIPPNARFHPHLTDYPQLASGMVFERSGLLLHVPGQVNTNSLLACLSMLSKLP
jgi:hypothetical protein